MTSPALSWLDLWPMQRVADSCTPCASLSRRVSKILAAGSLRAPGQHLNSSRICCITLRRKAL